MKNNIIFKDFTEWLKTNLSEFVVTPYVENMTDESFDISLENVKDLKITFSENGIQIWSGENISKKRNLVAEKIDLVTEIPIYEERHLKGYYCNLCINSEFYKTRHELWEDHVYKPFLHWVNMNILPEKFVCIYETEDQGSLWIKILTSGEIEEDNEAKYRISARPMIKGPKENE